MSESFDETLDLLKDLNLEDFSKHSFRGIAKEIRQDSQLDQ